MSEDIVKSSHVAWWMKLPYPRLTLGLIVTLVADALLQWTTNLGGRLSFIVAWDIGATFTLVLLYFGLRNCSASHMRVIAARQDAGKWAVLILTLIAATVSSIAIASEMPLVKDAQGLLQWARTLFMIYTIVLSWAFIQVIFALHYARDYYSLLSINDPDRGRHEGAIAFPGELAPRYGDFLYFAFTIGMTFQVSDVQIMDPSVRRLALAHGILSFFYATGILALSINLVAGLL
jgi:uncharacterized membrane protein